MKGNHNVNDNLLGRLRIVFNISKIQNERKSQHVPNDVTSAGNCVQHIKDTK